MSSPQLRYREQISINVLAAYAKQFPSLTRLTPSTQKKCIMCTEISMGCARQASNVYLS
jgi:hypothetical protein